MRADASLLPSDLSDPPQRRRLLSVARINEHARRHGVAVARVACTGEIDRTKLFTCPTLAPLSYSKIFAELTEPQQRRYNQLAALMANEIICFFEQEFAEHVLPALLRNREIPAEFAESLRQFLDDERQHTQMFRRLNRLAEPTWYAESDFHILRLPAPFRAALRGMTTRPRAFPMVFWIMLLMEERSLMMGRRYAAIDPATVEPHFAATYRAHLEDEIRHVQLDWHLLEKFYRSRPPWLRTLNGRLLEAFVVGLFLKPRRANVRLVDLLIDEFPELRENRLRLVAAVHALGANAGYLDMMYSADSTPIAKALFEHFPEFDRLRRRLYRDG